MKYVGAILGALLLSGCVIVSAEIGQSDVKLHGVGIGSVSASACRSHDVDGEENKATECIDVKGGSISQEGGSILSSLLAFISGVVPGL